MRIPAMQWRNRCSGAAGILIAGGGLLLVISPLAPSPYAPPGRDAVHLMKFWIAGVLLFALGAALNRRLRRVPAFLILAMALVGVWLMHPVCDPIADADLASFETVMPLQQRARQGDPFRQMDGRWYQCKSWIARQFFF